MRITSAVGLSKAARQTSAVVLFADFLNTTATYLAFIIALLTTAAPTAFGGAFTVFGPERFVRDTGKPIEVVRRFAAISRTATYTLRVENNDVTSATISLNGTEIVTESEFKRKVDLITKTVTLLPENELRLELRGKPGESLVISILGLGTATLTSVVPKNAAPGQMLRVNVTGDRTSFQPGVTTANFGPGISVGGAPADGFGPVTASSLTSLTAQVCPAMSSTSQWIPLNPDGAAPSPRAGHSLVLDPFSKRAILFGGFNSAGLFNEVWILVNADGVTGVPNWMPLAVSGNAPAPRKYHSVVFDAESNRMVAFGGCLDASCTTLSNEVWVLQNANGLNGAPQWVMLTATAPPSARFSHSAVYVPGSNRMVVFGGAASTGGLNDTWVLTNASGLGGSPQWGSLTPQVRPPARLGHSAVYDPASNRMIVFGGNPPGQPSFNDTWVLTNASGLGSAPQWSQLALTGLLPPGRSLHAAAYDPTDNSLLVLAGASGNTDLNDAWRLTNATGLGGTPAWSPYSPPGGPPTARSGGIAVFDPCSRRTTHFGGQNGVVFLNDLWAVSVDSLGAQPGPRTVITRTGPEDVSLPDGFTVVERPVISSVTPGAGQQGQVLQVALTGLRTNFVTGKTQVSFGAGIAVSSITVLSPTTLTALVTIPPNALLGIRNVTVTTDSEVAFLLNAFRVLAGTPLLLTVSPNTAQQGQQNLAVTITGQFTNFAPGVTLTDFGPGIVVNSVTVTSPLSLTANISTAVGAGPGPRTVTVTSAAEVVSLPNGFTVLPGTPVLLTVTPNTGQQGQQNLAVAITGQFTNFVQGTTQVSFGAGIAVTSVTVASATSLTAILSIAANAAPGPRTVSVGSISLPSGFTVLPGTPVLVTASPNTGQQGQQNLTLTITGQFTSFVQGTTQVSFGAGVTIGTVVVSSATSLTAQISIAANAAVGPRTPTVTTGSEAVSLSNGFTVQPGTPVLLSVAPNTGQQGQQNLIVTVIGQFSNFVQGSSQVSFGAGITVGTVTVANATSLTASISIAASAATGPRPVIVTTGAEVASLTNAFTVTTGTAVLLPVTPNAGQQGQQNLSVTMTGQFTGFAQRLSQVSFGAGITTGNVTVANATSLTAQITIAANAEVGSRTLTVTTGAEVVSLTNGFTVQPGTPALLSINPNTGQQGQHNLSVAIAGQFTNFVQGTTQVNLGAGITVTSVAVASATSLTANISIALTAALGPRAVTVITGTEVVSLANGFSVLATSPNRPPQAVDDTFTVTGRETSVVVPLGFQARRLLRGPPFVNIRSMTIDGAGNLFVGDDGITPPQDARIFKVQLSSKAVSTLLAGLPLSRPDQMLIGDGSSLVGRDLIAADHNSVETSGCCDGRVFRVDVNTGAVSVLARGAGGTGPSGGDPSGLALGSGGQFGNYLYVMDFQGASNDTPRIYRIDTNGVSSLFAADASLWTVNQIPFRLALASGGAFGSYLYVTDPADGGTPTIWRVTAAGSISAFVQGPSIGIPGSLRFGTGGAFGNTLYFIDYSDANSPVLKRVSPDGTVETFATNLPPKSVDLEFARDGHALYIAGGNEIVEILPTTSETTLKVPPPGVLGNDSDPDGQAIISTLTSGPAHGALSLAANGSFNYVPEPTFVGEETFTYTASDGAASSTPATVKISVLAPARVNHPPNVSAGKDITTGLTSISLTGSASDDGLPLGGLLTLEWTKLSGPGAVTFANPNASATTATFTLAGTYVLRLTANDSQLSSSAEATVTVNPPASLTSVLPNGGLQNQTLAVTITGQNTHFAQATSHVNLGAGITVNSVTVASATSLTANVSIAANAAVGARTVTVTTGTEAVSLANGFTVIAPNLAPVVNAGPDVTVTLPSPVSLNGSVSDDGLPAGSAPTVTWSKVSGPGTVAFANPNAAVTTATFSQGGTYVLRLTANDSVLVSTDDATVTVTPANCVSGREPGIRIDRGAPGSQDGGAAGVAYLETVQLPAGGLRAYYMGTDEAGKTRILSATSTDGFTWTKEAGTRLEQLPSASGIAYPKVVGLTNGSYRMYVSEFTDRWRILSAISTDGITWARDAGFRIDVGGPFNCVHVYGGDVVQLPSNSYRMYFSCSDQSSTAAGKILSAISLDGLSWIIESGVRLPGGANNTGLDTLAWGPEFQRRSDGSFRMYYSGANAFTSRIFSAASTDGLTWVNEDGIRQNLGSTGDSDSAQVAAPHLLPLSDGTFRFFYTGYDANLTRRVLSARLCTVGPNNPPTVSAGPDQTIALPVTSVNLTGSATDDGQPSGASLTYSWSSVSGPGAVTFGSAPSATTTATFALAGTYVLRLTVSDSQLSGADEVTVNVTPSAAPVISSVVPSSGQQGQQLSVTITGQSTHFVQATTQVTFGAGITVNSVTVASATSLTANVSIAANAVIGPRTVTVTTGTETVSLASGFTVTGPVIITLAPATSPNAGDPGATLMSISGIDFPAGAIQPSKVSLKLEPVNAGAGQTVSLTPSSLAPAAGTTRTVGFQIPTGIVPAPQVATIATGTLPRGVAFDGSNIWVVNQIDNSVTKIRASDGAVLGTFPTGSITALFPAFDGTNIWVTHLSGSTMGTVTKIRASDGALVGSIPVLRPWGLVFDGSNIWVANSDANSVTKIRASDGSVLGTFPTGGVGPLSVAFDGGNVWVVNITGSVSKIRASDGALLGIFLTGANPQNVLFDGTNIWIANLEGNSLTKLRASDGASLGVFPTSGTHPNGIAFDGTNIWASNSISSTIAKIRASDGALLGQPFPAGPNPAHMVFDGINMWVVNVGGSSVTKYPARSASTPYLVSVSGTAEDGTVFVSGNKSQMAVNPSASLVSISPVSALRGQTLSVIVTGQNTHFAQGTTAADFGPGITVNSVTVASAISLTANISIAANATLGARDVTITTGPEIISHVNGFTVSDTPVVPTLTSASPNTGQQGQQDFLVTITGQYTNFAQGTTQVSFGAGITVNSVSVSSPTSLAAQITIASNAALGPRTVTVTTGTEAAARANGFTVIAPNLAPVVNAGPDVTVTLPSPVSLNGSVSDDGLPAGGALTMIWSKVSGPGTVAFANPSAAVTTATFSQGGTHVLRLTASDSALAASDEVTIAVIPANCVSGKEPGVRIDLGQPGSLDAGTVDDPEILPVSSGGFRLYYTACDDSGTGSCRILSAFSADGVTWAKDPGVRIAPGGTDDDYWVATPSVTRLAGGSLRMFYTGTTRTGGIRILSAGSADGLFWTKDPGRRIDVGGPRGCVRVYAPSVIGLANGDLRLYYSCGLTDGTNLRGDILSARSTDGLTWTLEDGIRLSAIPPQVLGELELHALPDGRLRMYYSELDDGTASPTGRIRSAISTDGLAWAVEPGARIDRGAAGSLDSRWVSAPSLMRLDDGSFRVLYTGMPPRLPGDYERGRILSARFCWIGPNNPPTVSAGADQTITLPTTSVSLSGSASDDGLPAGASLAYTWTSVSGPGTVSFANANAAATAATFTLAGAYVLRLTVSDTALSASDDVSITVMGSQSVTVPRILDLTPSQADSRLLGSGLRIGTVTSIVEPVVLGLTTLPSQHGWRYEARNNAAAETQVFSLKPGVLEVSTIGTGSQGAGHNVYVLDGIVDSQAPFTVKMRARVLAEEGSTSTNSFGFAVYVSTGKEVFGFGLGRSRIQAIDNSFLTTIDNTQFHDYRLEAEPGLAYRFFVDDVLMLSGQPRLLEYDAFIGWRSRLAFGDSTGGTNALAEISSFSFQQAYGRVTSQSPLPLVVVPISSAVDYTAMFTPNGRPFVDAGTDISTTALTGIALAGVALDDGRPTTTPPEVSWSQIAGPGPVAFSNPNVAATTASFTSAGHYVLRLTARDAQLSNFDDLNVFVNPLTGAPRLLTVSPASGNRGGTLQVVLSGALTHFALGVTQVSFGDGVTVTSVSVTSPTTLTANLSIAANAISGSRTISVTTGAESVALADAFLIGQGQPALLSLTPSSLRQGEAATLTVICQYCDLIGGVTSFDLGTGVSVSNTRVQNSYVFYADVSVSPSAQLGPRTAVVSTRSQVVSLPGAFLVQPSGAVPILSSVVPSSGSQGTSLPVAITGQNTNFVQGSTQVSFGAGVTVNSIAVTSPTQLTAQISISASAATGARTVTVTTGPEVVSSVNGFTVTAASTPILTSMVPASGRQGQSVTSTVTGQFTHWVQGTTQVSLGAGITVTSVTVTNPTSLTLQLTIDANATVGTRSLTVTTGTEIVSASNVFTLQAGTPVLLSINPVSGQQGQQNLVVAITGQFTTFAQATSQVSFGAGVTVNSVTVTGATSLTANITIALSAATGPRTVTVTTGTETASLINGFTVQPTGPVLITLVPAAAQQGQQNVPVTIAAQGTNFAQGSSQVSFGAGITINTVNVANSTSLTANISVAANAVVGPRTVTVTTGTEIATLTSGFAVQGGGPALTVISPFSGRQGQTLPVALTGQFTNWAQGTTTAAFGVGITVNSVTVTDATHLTANVTIAANATIGPRMVTVTTGTQVLSAADAFDVLAGLPAILSVNPTTGTQGQQNLNVAITGQFTNFVQGVTQVSFQAGGVTVNSVTVTNATSLTANITIALNAQPVARTVSATTGTEVVTLVNGFTVQAATNQAPIITIAPSWNLTLPDRLTITYTVTDDGLPNGGALTVSWEKISGPGNHGFSDQTPTSISVGFDATGTYVLRITATDTQLTVFRDVTVNVTGTPQAPPTVSLATPVEGQEITTLTDVIGTVNSSALASWTLEYRMQEETFFRSFATGTANVASAKLGTFDPTLLLNGIALIRLRATDTTGQSTTTEPVSVVLSKNQKVGQFTVSFKDLEVPLAGIGIQVIRTYDSRNSLIGDFGVGWTLDIRNVRLRDNGAMGVNWQGTVSGGVLNRTYCLVPTKAHVVTVILSDGTVYKFEPTVTPQCQALVPILQATIGFQQISGPKATLALAGTGTVVTQDSWPGPMNLLDENTLEPVDYDNYRLIFPDGRVLALSRSFGLQTLTDLNQNTLTITANGITHSNGKGIAFQRDTLGRITRITDPAGKILTYGYDGSGDLVSFTDQVNNVSTYTYDANHRLLTIKDPRGIEPIRNEYDASGRLLRNVDAFGNTINYTHDIANRKETVTDRVGNSTVNEYDADGNVVRVTDPLGGITARTYDGRGNLLTETNALGKTRTFTYDANDNRLTETDPLNNTTTYTYNGLNQVLFITDALGRVTANTYSGNGNLLSTRDALNNTTTYSYDSAGSRASTTDPLGNTTQYGYNAFGQMTSQTDALGKVTTFTYDANGNRLTETRTRTTPSGPETLVTSYQYDSANRLTQTTYPDGSVTKVSYDSIGKQASTTDQLNRQTAYTYDSMGRLTQTAFPDGTTEKATYDAEGRRVSSIDRANRTTQFTYDALGRLTRTTLPDGAFTTTTYDAVGQATQTADGRGNVTRYTYDDAGRRTQVTNPLNQVTSFTYDKVGSQTSLTDARGNLTQYQYDANNRRVKVTYADATFDQVGYDALGRTTSKTDQAAKVTQFQYDKLGRLTQVTDALSQVTVYGYDDVGNRITQTDALGRTTRFEYDKLGRRTKRTLPLGMSETMAYDTAGNLVNRRDFNGKTTTFAYDATNRLVSKTPDASLSEPVVSFSYTATGQRATMADASGTSSYLYDSRDRLLSKATPQGTLAYTYDLGGNLLTIRSSNAGGTTLSYAYDTLNRLSTVTDNRLAPNGTTTYNYDAAGNLQSYLYPNGVQHSYTYSALNRLTNLAVAKSATTLASYGYTLAAAGNRTKVVEFGGRTVDYGYDALYRLTGEAIAGGSVNGTIGYTYDAVGNRLTRTSTVAPVPATSQTYDANDRLAPDTYDSNGNTVGSGGVTYTYDFENHLKTKNGAEVGIVYDGDGNRVAKTVGGVTTRYLVDDRNLTGYAQVLEEVVGGTVARVYTYGLNRISQSQASGTSFYGYDGHGSVRLLTDATGAVTDRYDYDAFGNVLSQVGTTPNLYLYSGEQNDPNLAMHYLRARYLSQSTGRFWSMDAVEGIEFAPITLHKYLYANADPTDNIDPTGAISISDVNLVVAVLGNLSSTFLAPGRFVERLVERFLYCGVNPITNRAGIVAACTGVIGQLRPGVGGDGRFGSRGGRHQGIDISAPVGTPVHANRAGTVTFSGWAGGYGNTVVIRHATNASTLYAHLQAPSGFGNGSLVRQGDVIGSAGRTGNVPASQLASEDHLHFGYKASDITVTRGERFDDPVAYLNSRCP